MAYDVNPGNIEWVCANVLKSINDGQFSHGEVMLGITQALGRVVINAADTPVQGSSAMQVIVDHLNETLKAGYIAKGYNMVGH